MKADVRAQLPPELKRQVMSILALRGKKFSTWCREKVQELVTDHSVSEQRAQHVARGANGVQKE